jgi:hypothetical protein
MPVMDPSIVVLMSVVLLWKKNKIKMLGEYQALRKIGSIILSRIFIILIHREILLHIIYDMNGLGLIVMC